MTATRVTHLVRCRSQNDPQTYVDVEVLDAIILLQANGQEVAIAFASVNRIAQVVPYIVDPTGGGNGRGSPTSFTRVSHMERMTSQDDPTQILDIEILDGFVVIPPNMDSGDGPDEDNDSQNDSGWIDSGGVQSAPQGFACAPSLSLANVVDTTGMGLEESYGAAATRTGHINVVTNAGDTDDGTQFSDGVPDSIPPANHAYIATVKTDAISFGAPNGNTKGFFMPTSQVKEFIDATKYVTDPYTGESNSPPDNTDPNIYVSFPSNSDGANLGANPTSAQTGLSRPVSQGPLWWIKKISSNGPDPWFWWCPIQTPLAFSYFGTPPDAANPKWGYRGYQLLNYYPVIWILSENLPLSPMGNFGATSLDACATGGNWDVNGTIPTAPIFGTGGFEPFGYLPVLDPPLADNLLDQFVPNIWQLTGITQPNLVNPNLAWDRLKNPYRWPSPTVWEQVAQAFAANWQSVADGVNEAIKSEPFGAGTSGLSNPPPGWKWSVPYTILHGSAGYSYSTYDSFQSGIEPLEVGYGLPATSYVPATCATLNVGQLDQKKWNTKPSLNGDLTGGFSFNPVLRT